ncbi:MAG: enolase C-terminal domain-like protein [Planctomycetota bacterium]
MQLRVRSFQLDVRPCRTRLPFRFGAATVTAAPLLTARLVVDADGAEAVGLSGDFAMPKWFDKNPEKSAEESSEDLVQSAREAAAAYAGHAGGTAFGIWRDVYGARVGGTPEDAPDRLVRGFGVALFERALIDAACRAADASLLDALRGDALGFRPAEVHADLAGWELASELPAAQPAGVRLRHTVGGADPLRAEDIAPEARVDDGLPVALEEDIERYGLTSFKVKLIGDPRIDARRLLTLAEFFHGQDIELTLDANEQYDELEELARVLDVVGTTDEGHELLSRLMYVEQPLHRARSFEPALTAPLAALPVPVILDEADHGVEAFPRALELGYGGVSVKNCKGVFRALINRGICAMRGGFQSAEDLTNVPLLPLHQDLATLSLLGLEHAERNGHHYFRGLDHLTPPEREAALAHHPELYRSDEDGVFLRIEGGALALSSLAGPGFASAAAHAALG